MIDLIWNALCTRAIIDAETNSLSLIDIIEQVNVEGESNDLTEKMIPLSFELVSFWVRKDIEIPAQGEFRVLLLSPADELLGKIERQPIDLTKFERLRGRLVFNGFKVKGPGLYKFVIELKNAKRGWKRVGSTPLVVRYTAKDERRQKKANPV